MPTVAMVVDTRAMTDPMNIPMTSVTSVDITDAARTRPTAGHRLAALTSAAAGSGAAILLSSEGGLVLAGISPNHNESAGRDRRTRRGRRAVAALALAAAVSAPVAVVTASPASAATACPTWMCGDGNHNESAGRDRRR